MNINEGGEKKDIWKKYQCSQGHYQPTYEDTGRYNLGKFFSVDSINEIEKNIKEIPNTKFRRGNNRTFFLPN